MRPTFILGALHLSALSHGSPTKRTATTPGQTSVGQPSTAKDNFTVSILADTNRDGKVDLTGDSDTVGKETWTDDVGALFLANIVDTDRRCSSQITGACASELGAIFNATLPPETPVLDPRLPDLPKDGSMKQWLDSLDESQRSLYDDFLLRKEEYEGFSDVDRKISACNDASDDILRNATYLAPLRTRPIPGLGDSATGTITITRTLAASKVRLFYKQEAHGQWVFITSNHTFGAQELRAGLELGIDARDVRRPGGWDGRATVKFRVKYQGKEAQDSVALRVAPVLTQHHGQVAKQLLTSQVDGDDGRDPAHDYFVDKFRNVSSSLGLQSPVHAFEGCNEVWTQDFFEPGYMSIPGPSGPVSLHIMIRSAQDWREAGRMVFQDLRSNIVGAVQHLASGGTTDSTGNLETIPPYSYNGKSYPAGRAVLGSQMEEPYMVDFLEAQEVQAPIHLNTSWLLVGHTDEFFQFLPANNTLGWVLMADDPLAGLEMLLQAQQAGHGKDKAVSRPQSPHDPEAWYVTTTIDELLNDPGFVTVQNKSFNSIADNIEILKRETGLTDADIIRLPGLYELDVGNKTIVEGPWKYAEKARNGTAQVSRRGVRNKKIPSVLEAGTPPSHLRQRRRGRRDGKGAGSPERRQSKWSGLERWTVAALYPGTINSVVVDKKHIIAANPWGPIIDGHDVLRAATDEAYAKAGYTVSYVDDWFTHHTLNGEVHCGSNAIRHLAGDQWW
ncbi:hypothetical protein NHJ13734_002947 [Beauveria thailandica]